MIFFLRGQISVPFHEKEKERFDMNITVNGKEYILEYTFEAAECHECIDAAMDIFGGMMTAKIDSKHSEEMQVRDFLMSLSDLPRMAMDMFYAGLLENHRPGQREIRSLLPLVLRNAMSLSRSYRTDTKHVLEIKAFSFPVVKHNESVWHGLF